MEDILKVLMMGGQRAGKSSVLAGLVDTMTNGPIKEILTVKDISKGNTDLNIKIRNLKYHLETSLDKTYLIDDDEKTRSYEDYILQISVPKTESKMNIIFTDAAGEFYDLGRSEDKAIRNYIRNYDVFIVAVDTPFLMEAVNDDNKLCNEAINKSYNHVIDLHSFLAEVDDKNGSDAKLVIFAPLKCEKWVKEGKISDVVDRVKKVYDSTLKALSKYVNIEVDIMPIQTVGNIVFCEHLLAKTLIIDEKETKRCSIIGNNKLRLKNGDEITIDRDHHRLEEDATAITHTGSKLIRPNSWFKTINTKYEPENCDQLAYYILDFFLAKVLFSKNIEKLKETKSLWKVAKIIATAIGLSTGGIFYAIVSFFTAKYLEKKFGTFTVEQMKSLMDKIRGGGYIKHNTDGIETIKDSKLHTL